MEALAEFDRMCDRFGIPKDRKELVKRNLKLKSLLLGAIRSIEEIAAGLHGAHEHPFPIEICNKDSCKAIIGVAKLLREEMNS